GSITSSSAEARGLRLVAMALSSSARVLWWRAASALTLCSGLATACRRKPSNKAGAVAFKSGRSSQRLVQPVAKRRASQAALALAVIQLVNPDQLQECQRLSREPCIKPDNPGKALLCFGKVLFCNTSYHDAEAL